jgi:hypothetical protein
VCRSRLVTTASNILPTGPVDLIGAIGHPSYVIRCPRGGGPGIKARTRKNATGKYTSTLDNTQQPATCAPLTKLNATVLPCSPYQPPAS